jgi:hypothetical protein
MKYVMFCFIATSVLLASCKKEGCTDPNALNFDASATKDDGSCVPEVVVCYDSLPSNSHSGFITSDELWTSDQVHTITGKVIVSYGTTLTIEPGTIIKAKEGSGTLSSALVVERGGRIIAEGTPLSPIIFTSVLDNIELGQLSGTNLSEDDKGLWGGIIMLGASPISASDGDTDTQIQGIPAGEQYLEYGGTNPTDDSGIFKYVSIRHAGVLFGAGNEINGLTLGGVGSGTQIDHVELIACQDDGIQIFGGTVNVTNAIVGYAGDDAIETLMNFDGSVSNAVVILNDDSDKAIDMRGPEGLTYINGVAEMSNISVLNDQASIIESRFRTEVKATLSNIDFNGNVLISASYESDCLTPLPNALNNLIGSNLLTFSNCSRDALQINASPCTVPAADQSAAEAAFSVGTPIGADISEFTSWTWLSVNGKL